ncbi:uncharacterized protein LOC121753067 isoform X2 [Salvia splendens]|uniref:uncharacterized protein LOC121753067 isoform X2 n=1 Tax=Salvia splendens TaxID=180675 RepID=UPI001C26E028|nr:uncharacterized protein LOC121753067 isoform X2 [Salvia splendens]XP_042004160.1 uncharacterized protein LOC121753067 isoform X2 [Salvia splendens]
MDADEKLTALKKAYADIILGISKEAAVRVMASEKKSVRYQHELKAAKEEGVRMLMRLKHMMDAKNSEAEAAGVHQQNKIEELEAQLQEAEDIVRDLRDELSDVQAELERMKSGNSHHIVKHKNTCLVEIPVEDKISSCQSYEYLPPNKSSVALGATVSHPVQRNECQKCYTKIACICGAYVRDRDLPSIVLRGKDPGLYRNGCTQRIRACERNHSDRDLSLSEETDKVTDEKNVTEQMEARDTSETPASGGKILTELEKKLLAEINLGTFQPFPQKRRRAVRRRKMIKPLAGKGHSLLQKPDQLPAHSSTSDGIPAYASAENPSEIGPRFPRDEAELQTQRECTKATQDNSEIVEICNSAVPMGGGVNEEVMPLELIAGCLESLPTDSEMDVTSHNLNSFDITEGLSRRPARERVFKYTFQRKRKREALVVSEVNGTCETEKKIRDEQNGNVKQEQSKLSLSKESSRECRRLAQVARQLISLSDKKWWR